MDKYNIDSHKLIYHPERVSSWLKDEKIYPLYVEISLTSACNHRCRFCAPKFFLNYKPEYMDTATIKKTIKDMANCGVKAIMFGGEGEPTLHKDFVDIVKYTKDCGIDVSITTNGVLFNNKIANELLPILTWIKFSVDSGSGEDYSYLHGTKKSDYKIVLDNISKAAFNKRLKKYSINIGVQALLFKCNIEKMLDLAKILKYLHPDYFVVKPYSEHNKSINSDLEAPTEDQLDVFIGGMQQYKKDYEFIYRDIAFSNINKERSYNICYGKDFMAYIDTLGNIYSCINFIGNNNFIYGNIYKDSFENIWKNKKEIEPNLDECRKICILDNINRYLFDLKNPKKDVNFI